MTRSITAHTTAHDSDAAGRELGKQILAGFDGKFPDALILFASSQHDFKKLLLAIDQSCHPRVMVGSSSAGEFTSLAYGVGSATAIALRSSAMEFTSAVARGLRAHREEAAAGMINTFRGLKRHDFEFKSALVLTDALAGHADDFVEHLTTLTAGTYQLFGGGAGDDAKFKQTHVFCGTEVITDAAVALEILSHKAIGVGVRHSWEPATPGMRVTEASGMKLVSLNNIPAVEVFQDFAREQRSNFNLEDPIPFFLHNTLGIATPAGHKIRVPLAVNPDGSMQCAADIPEGSIVHIMKPRGGSAAAATAAALQQLKGAKPAVALFFDCVATRLRMGGEFGFELSAVRQTLGDAHYAGCNTYGQIARSEGQFSGFHNCTAVVAIIPQ